MQSEKFTTTSMSISAILGLIKANDIAIPEIQRPFVWKSKQVRDLLDSLYRGFPVGYIIIWKNPNVKLKDGSISSGKKVLIDGQQRITAMMTAIAGREIYDDEYKLGRVKIAFNPIAALSGEDEAELFAVQTPAHLKSKHWIPDVADIFSDGFSLFKFINEYCANNPDITPEQLDDVISRLKAIQTQSIGIIELSESLEIDIVTDIFVRINSKGTTLNQGDFVMSKIAADELHGGNSLRKIIDYFSHLAVVPSYYDYILSHDKEFCAKPEGYIKKLEWLKNDNETVYDPQCDDIIRVAFMHQFQRAKLAELVKMLSGRDFDTREFKEEIIEDTYNKLYKGVTKFINEHNFKQFVIAIKSAGFITSKLINSNMAIDFAYALHLILRDSDEVSVSEIKRVVQRWYVLSVLTGRYSNSPESAFAKDLRQISEFGVVKTLKNIEDAVLSENFWNVQIPQDLTNTSTNNPTYLVYLAAQVYFNDISLLSQNICVKELIELGGDVHHIFPKQYLKDNGFEKNRYNQEANYAYLDRPVNESIGKQAPINYFRVALEQCKTKVIKCGSITDINELKHNLAMNCIPDEVFDMDYSRYVEFLEKRRILMAKKIRRYYEGL
ncbi:MAG: DUF262 domain-containing protein [Paludibacteraceae bacterium]|nr:DUF262 domain-containing protein [Paludibacteraceae bacterium]